MASRLFIFRRLWGQSPKKAFAYFLRSLFRQARHLMPSDDWNKNWLGEEMRPFNSLRSGA